MELFGFEIKRKKEEREQEQLVSFVPPTNDDGAATVTGGGVFGTYVDMDGAVRTEAELVDKYRAMSIDPIIDLAIQDIVNEAIVEDSDEDTVSIVLDDLETQDSIKKSINEEFDNVLSLLEFNRLSYEIFKRWYIDGRIYYHAIIDEKKPKEGIKELRYIDPRNIKKIREVKKEKTKEGATLEKLINEYYVYSPSGFLKRTGTTMTFGSDTSVQGLKISKDSIVYCTSGYQNSDNQLILSYLHKAIRPLNQLRAMEDSMIIYRISRAPERRIFYVDVGGLPKAKAEQYLRDIMTKFKNKVVYDSSTGEIRDDRKFMTMLEDFWLPRRDGNRGTEITTLPGGQNLGEIDDIVYFQNLLFRSLNVPATRLQPETTFTLGRATEISRDEVKFSKFITRLRSKFGELFTKLLERQLLLKGICTPEDWREWKSLIQYDFAIDNYFEELKQMEILRDRVGLVREMDEYIGKYYSHEYVRRFVLQQNENEMKEIDKQIKDEEDDEQYEGEGEDFGQMPPQPKPQPKPTPAPTPAPQPKPEPKPESKPEPNSEKEEQKEEYITVTTNTMSEEEKMLVESMTRFYDSMSEKYE